PSTAPTVYATTGQYRCGCGKVSAYASTRVSVNRSDRDNPVPAELGRQLVVQPVGERRPVLVQEPDKADGAFLRVSARKHQGADAHELAAQRFVAALGRLNHLAAQRLDVVLHAAQRGTGCTFERRIERREGRGETCHALFDGALETLERFVDRCRNVR